MKKFFNNENKTAMQFAKEYMQTDECKKKVKQGIIEHFKTGECPSLGLNEYTELLNDDDWEEIAKEVGDRISIVGNVAFTSKYYQSCKSFG